MYAKTYTTIDKKHTDSESKHYFLWNVFEWILCRKKNQSNKINQLVIISGYDLGIKSYRRSRYSKGV